MVSIKPEKELAANLKLQEHKNAEALRVTKLIRSRSYGKDEKINRNSQQDQSSSSGKDLLSNKMFTWISFDEKNLE